MQASDLSTLNSQVLWAGLVLSAIFGAIAQRTHFCTMGAVSDVVNMGDWTRMKQWALAIGVAIIGFAVLAYSGHIDPTKTLYSSNKLIWLSAASGGLLFGFGMVLASGCGSKTLVRMGGGSLKSLIVFIVMGVAAFATLKGITAVLRVATVDKVTVDMATGVTLAQWLAPMLGVKTSLMGLLLGAVLGGGLLVWTLGRKEFRTVDNLLAGVGIGCVITAMWWVSGHLGFVAEHPETLQEAFLATNSGRAEALSFVSPVAYTLDWLMFFSDKSKVLTLGVVSVVGVVLGSALTALASKTFRWEGFGGSEDVANHLVGATLMGIGGVTAMGCTVGQGLSGVSTLSASSFIAVTGILLGAVGAFRYQIWRLNFAD
jgi:uncharacterized membrane protein YedE/YeeE